MIAVFVFLQPQFRLFDVKSTEDNPPTANTTISQNIPDTQKPTEGLQQDTSEAGNSNDISYVQPTLPKPQQTKPLAINSSPLSLSLPLIAQCNENQKAKYTAQYQADVDEENSYHESEIARITGLSLIDDLLQETLSQEDARHQSALESLQSNLDSLLRSIACE